MHRLVILGIDSMDRELVSEFKEDLPNIHDLTKRSESTEIRSKGVFPPDSPTSWASIFTGDNPAKHGVVNFSDPLEKASRLFREEIDNATIKGRTFWDLAGSQGKKSVVLWPLLGYPTWDIKGVMVGRATTSGNVEMKPMQETEKRLLRLRNLKGLPGRNPQRYIKDGIGVIEEELLFSKKYFLKDWDVFFYYSSVLDPIQHCFWNCYDRTDPTYEDGNKYEHVIKDFYERYDRIVGSFCDNLPNDARLILMSDHGHGRRPVKTVNINGILCNSGYMKVRKETRSMKSVIYNKRSQIFDAISRHRLGSVASKLMGLVPQIKSVFTKPDAIDWKNTTAYACDLSGIKAYTYGGIAVSRSKVSSHEYESIRDGIIDVVSGLRDPENGKRVVDWIMKRENLYTGPFIGKYPDIVMQLREDYGLGWSVDGTAFGRSDSHNIQPGSHRQDTPFMCIFHPGFGRPTRNEMTLMDVAPTVLDMLEINTPVHRMDGHSIFSK